MQAMKTKRQISIPKELDTALKFAAFEKDCHHSDLIAEALRLYLPTISQCPQVLAIAAPTQQELAS